MSEAQNLQELAAKNKSCNTFSSVPVKLEIVDTPNTPNTLNTLDTHVVITEENACVLAKGVMLYQGKARVEYTFVRYNSDTKKLFATHNSNKTLAKLDLGSLTF
jgi:hypothetical protein